MRKFFILFFFSTSILAYSQNSLDDIDFLKVPQKKIRSFIKNQKDHNIHKFSEVKPTFYVGQDITPYRKVEKKYFIKENINKVWDCYKSTSPSESWKGKMISFGLLLSKSDNKVMYSSDSFSGVDTGQVVYVNLRILKGLYNLAVAFEIISIDTPNKEIIFSYVEGGKSQGEQSIQFIDTKDGYTEIIHSTLFKSGSKFRDKYLYPKFHLKAINEFHKNVLRKILAPSGDKKLNEALISKNNI
jgi:hypothetical protein